ncbi:helix-turn-helix domain-containing protein [Lacticaseibacillus zeae]|uniref:Helix-turn-helix transcriptional regulator n=1 Tax=Lacticaseibacillus zeae TaxID=57037 RepID=A0A5R8M2S4_LACZE|nr:helix-turn-helix transcriptional regulator [Lacticaseibacillus zeae]TLF42509.1 helix-turn-helix transcriptional regulator [Lacticaseibacillus zeae]
MKKDIDFDDYLREQVRDSAVKEAYDRESNKLEVAVVISQAREVAGLTQRAIASKAGIPQATVARVERGDNTSIETLGKIANALGKHIKLSLI